MLDSKEDKDLRLEILRLAHQYCLNYEKPATTQEIIASAELLKDFVYGYRLHARDCAVYNIPAEASGSCTCGAQT